MGYHDLSSRINYTFCIIHINYETVYSSIILIMHVLFLLNKLIKLIVHIYWSSPAQHDIKGMQVGFLKYLEDVATVLLDLVCLSLFCFFMSFQTDWMMMRSDLCVEHWLLSDSLC